MHGALGQIAVLEAAAGEDHLLLPDLLCDFDNRLHKGVVKQRGHRTDGCTLGDVLQKLEHHRFPINYHRSAFLDCQVIGVVVAGFQRALQLHRRLALKPHALAQTHERRNRIEEPPHAGRHGRLHAALDHLAQHCQLIIGETSHREQVVPQKGLRPHQNVEQPQGRAPRLFDGGLASRQAELAEVRHTGE